MHICREIEDFTHVERRNKVKKSAKVLGMSNSRITGDIPLMKSLGEVRVASVELRRIEENCERRFSEGTDDPFRMRRRADANAIESVFEMKKLETLAKPLES